MRSTMPLLAVALILAANACAQIDVDPNGVGIYFDQAATQTSADSGIPVPPDAATVQAWLIATRCSLAGEVSYWEGTVRTAGRYGMICGNAAVGQNIAGNMPGETHWSFLVFLGPGEVLPVTVTTVLASLQIGIFPDGDGPTWLYVENVRAQVGTTAVWFHPSSGATDLPVAVVNGEAPVPAQAQTWGAVKAMYAR